MRSLLVFLLLTLFANLEAQQTTPPLLTFYAPEKNAKYPDSLTWDPAKKLLIIHSVAEVRLASDDKGVLIRMTLEDARAFSELTRKFNGQYLIVQGGGNTSDAMEVLHITGEIEDGYLGFRWPEEQKMADYLRKILVPASK